MDSSKQAFRDNFSVAESDHHHLRRCWSRQDCGACLAQDACSWCPFTWACVPNSHAVPLLAPAYDEHVCPHPAERWELRAPPFGCRVSTTTALTAIGSVVATGLVALCVLLNVVAVRRWRRYTMRKPDWRQHWTYRWREALAPPHAREREPLLSP